jgi:hypothetical protein
MKMDVVTLTLIGKVILEKFPFVQRQNTKIPLAPSVTSKMEPRIRYFTHESR